MLREAIGTGETIVEAQEDACKQLGVETHEANFDVLQMPEKKKFGLFGGSPAKVRAFLELSSAQMAEDYLKSILIGMGLTGITMEITEVEGGAEINLSGEDVSYVIGRRGETLDALQYLAGLVANHTDNDTYYRITINTGNYREKREKTLEILGKKLAFKAVKSGANVPLEPMNPYERRIIHTAVQTVNGALSWSEGESLNRHVVIGPDPKARRPYRKEGGYNKPGGQRRPYNNSGGYNRSNSQGGQHSSGGYNRSNSQSSQTNRGGYSDQAQKRPPKNEGGNFSLYGKIETKKED